VVIEYVNGIKVAWEIAKAVKVSADAIDDAQIKLQVAELIGALADARIQAAESSELIASLELRLKSKIEMKFNGSVYFKVNDANEQDGPWCPTCYDARHLEIRLHAWRAYNNRGYERWHCRECQAYFT
tara:strand:+ start:69 stop:452 length:384 start_codon:yes stop_codon:yes gene_type:complete